MGVTYPLHEERYLVGYAIALIMAGILSYRAVHHRTVRGIEVGFLDYH
jgi:hypothetical protein